MTEASLSWLKHLSLQLRYLTGISFKVSLRITANESPCFRALYKVAIYKGVKQAFCYCATNNKIRRGAQQFWKWQVQRPCLLLGITSDGMLKAITKLFDNWFQCLTSEKSDFHFHTWRGPLAQINLLRLSSRCGRVLTITQSEAADWPMPPLLGVVTQKPLAKTPWTAGAVLFKNNPKATFSVRKAQLQMFVPSGERCSNNKLLIYNWNSTYITFSPSLQEFRNTVNNTICKKKR